MPVLQPQPVKDGDGVTTEGWAQPILILKEENNNVRYEEWKAWIKREPQWKPNE